MKSAGKVISVAVRLSLIAAMIILPGYARSSRQDRRDFWLLNITGKRISRFYVSPHDMDSWGRDILGQAELPNGLGTLIAFNSTVRTSCLMDFRLVFSDGTKQTYTQGRNVCKLSAIQFSQSASTPFFIE